MIDTLPSLPANRRERLEAALATGALVAPYSVVALRSAMGGAEGLEEVQAALLELAALGIEGRAAAAWIRTAARAKQSVTRPELVWTGPEVPGLHARDTRQVFDEMLGSAEKSIWASTYAYYDGQAAFDVLARRMDDKPELEVTMLMNVGRKQRDTRTVEALVGEFADRFWKRDWPGQRRPRVFYDPRSIEQDSGDRSVLHAKALVQDERTVFVTSANFTEAALDRNIELGLKVADPTLARQVVRHYQRLIEDRLLTPLPQA